MRPIANAGCVSWQRADESMKPLSSEGKRAEGAFVGESLRVSFGDVCVGAPRGGGVGRLALATGTESSVAHLAISPPNASTTTNTAATAPTVTTLAAETR